MSTWPGPELGLYLPGDAPGDSGEGGGIPGRGKGAPQQGVCDDMLKCSVPALPGEMLGFPEGVTTRLKCQM